MHDLFIVGPDDCSEAMGIARRVKGRQTRVQQYMRTVSPLSIFSFVCISLAQRAETKGRHKLIKLMLTKAYNIHSPNDAKTAAIRRGRVEPQIVVVCAQIQPESKAVRHRRAA